MHFGIILKISIYQLFMVNLLLRSKNINGISLKDLR